MVLTQQVCYDLVATRARHLHSLQAAPARHHIGDSEIYVTSEDPRSCVTLHDRQFYCLTISLQAELAVLLGMRAKASGVATSLLLSRLQVRK